MFETIVHQFVRQMNSAPEQLALVCIEEDDTELKISRADFLAAVQRQAHSLKSQGVSEGDVFLIVLPHGMDLFSAFWGALLLGAVPVVYPYPRLLETQQSFYDQLDEFVRQIQCDSMLVPPELFESLEKRLRDSGTHVFQANGDTAVISGPDLEAIEVSSLEQTAIVQFSSGTTGAKKGVVISHRAMINYIPALKRIMNLTSSDVMVSWLPLNHDMGLIACFVVPLTLGFPTVIMSPRHWLKHPASLFRAIHRYRGTTTFMPNFAFNYCTHRLPDEELDGLDLSSWRALVNGAEPVQPGVLHDFARRFAPYGLKESVIQVGYGMAECVLSVARTPLDNEPRVDLVDQHALSKDGKAVLVGKETINSKSIVSCGPPLPHVEIRIVGETGEYLCEREVGEIQVKSSAMFSGYYLQPKITRAAMIDNWFRTGDLGYLHDGELYVCGRKNDVIVSFGNNIYPQDVEKIAESLTEVRHGRSVAFGVYDENKGTENIVLLCELRNELSKGDQKQLINIIRQRIWEKLNVLLAHIEFVERGWVIKTTSGKLARSANKEKYLTGLSGTAG